MDAPTFAEKSVILVVDDTPDNLSLMSGLLKDDYKVKIANSGERALKVAVSDTPPDLILLDIMMPEMDGYEVLKRLRTDPKTSDIPVILNAPLSNKYFSITVLLTVFNSGSNNETSTLIIALL